MPIEVKNAVGPGPIVAAAYGAGQGATRTRFLEDQLQEQAAKRAAEDAQDFRREMVKRQEEFQKDAANTEQVNRIALVGIQEDLESKRRKEEADAAQKRRRDDYEWEYTTQQRHEAERLAEARATVQASETMTPEEKEEALRQIEAKQAGIVPVPRLKSSPYPKGQGVGETWESPDGSILMGRDKDGKVYKVGNTGKPTQKDRNDALKAIIATATDAKTGAVDWNLVKQRMAEVGMPWGGDSTKPTPGPFSGESPAPGAPSAPGATGGPQQAPGELVGPPAPGQPEGVQGISGPMGATGPGQPEGVQGINGEKREGLPLDKVTPVGTNDATQKVRDLAAAVQSQKWTMEEIAGSQEYARLTPKERDEFTRWLNWRNGK